MLVEIYPWTQARRSYLADDLVSRLCPECGYGRLHYRDFSSPLFQSGELAKKFHIEVLFGDICCTNYGNCEMAPG